MEPIDQVRIDFPEPDIFDKATLDKALLHVVKKGGDDLILLSGYPFAMLWTERLVRLGVRPLTTDEISHLLEKITDNANAPLSLRMREDLDFTYVIKDQNTRIRFRVNATGCLGPHGGPGIHLVFRPTNKIPKTMDELGLPAEVQAAARPKSGIVLVTGPTGSGKTTLLDSIMRAHLEDPMGKHVLTYYSPVENDLNVIPNKVGMVAQSEIGESFVAHLKDYKAATRNSLRRHPQVIAYGEARDRETIDGAVLSAMTGHATYTTTHTDNVYMAISRMADVFPESDRIRISNALIDNSRLILNQRLLRRRDDEGRCPVRSWLVTGATERSHLLGIPYEKLGREMHELVKEVGMEMLVDARRQYDCGVLHPDEMKALEMELGRATYY